MNTDTPDSPPATETAAAQSSPAAPSPGTLIREARERARLSLEDMAAHTKLARHTLEALERDDYNALLEPVYVRGYYRKCAKVLELDEERLIAAYRGRVLPKNPEAPSKLRLASGTELGSSSRLPVSMAVLAVIVAVVVCGFIWFAQDGGRETYPVAVPSLEIEDETVPADAPSVPVEQVVAEPLPATESTARVPDGRAAAVAEPTPTPQPAGAPGTLRLRFEQTSWVRVDDAGGRALVNEIKPAGSEQTLNGALPFSVFLGNAPGVVVEYEGRALDIKRFVRDNNTARFSVPLQ